MAESKRYYWLKLYDNFFDSLRIKKLRKMSAEYVIIYLKMQLKAIKTGGFLKYTGLYDDFVSELSEDLNEKPASVRATLEFLLSCGLAETTDNINYFLPYAVENTGSETASAQRVRDCREKQKVLHCNNDVTEMKQACSVEIEKEKEKEIEIEKRDRGRVAQKPSNPFLEMLKEEGAL